jgi:hypothetical protein
MCNCGIFEVINWFGRYDVCGPGILRLDVEFLIGKM